MKRHKNTLAQGMQYDISESLQKDTEVAGPIVGNGKPNIGVDVSGDSSESDSDDEKKISEDTTVNRASEMNIQESAEPYTPKDSLFKGGVSKGYDV